MKHEKADCPVCHGSFAVSVDGTLRKHPRGADEPCAGTGYPVSGPLGAEQEQAEAAAPPDAPRRPRALVPGTYRAGEPMLESGTPIPPGHVAISLIAYVPFDGAERSPAEEATLLFEDPGHLYRVLDDTPNAHVRLVLKVPPRAKPVYSDTTSPASDPGATTGATP